jgi:callose synthase
MRNLLEEFSLKRGKHFPSILGVREHVFTGRYYFGTTLLKWLLGLLYL